MLVTLNEILPRAQKNGYAVGAFNVYNLETAKAVLAAAILEKSPIILATSEKAIAYAGLSNLAALILDMAERSPVPVALHLDHGRNPDIVKECLGQGYSSVMFDASHLKSQHEKINQTRRLADLAHQHDASLEGEYDSIGGQEDYIQGDLDHLSRPEVVAHFVQKTGLDALAVSIGNVHGQPVPGEKLHISLLRAIKEKVAAPLVLHGASSTPAEEIHLAIGAGITKINIDTELRQTFISELQSVLTNQPHIDDPRELLTQIQQALTHLVRTKIRLFGSSGRA